MAEKKTASQVSVKNTKQELVDAYNELLKQRETKRESERKPEDRIAEKAVTEAVQVADSLSTEIVTKLSANLKAEVSRLTGELADRLEEEIGKYRQINRAVEAKERELQEIYEIQRMASSLAALIEAQHLKRDEFEADMAARKEELTREIQMLRVEWEKEKKLHEAETKERDAAESKRRERDKDEFRYAFTREQNLARDQFADDKAKLEREILVKREEMERELAEREKSVAAREAEFESLRTRVDGLPKELDATVAKTIKETTARLAAETNAREELIKKEFLGEKNVFQAKIESHERKVAEQAEHIAKLSQQLEKAYAQVQDIAVKAIDGSASAKSLANLQQMLLDQTRRPAAEK